MAYVKQTCSLWITCQCALRAPMLYSFSYMDQVLKTPYRVSFGSVSTVEA
ncbi:AAEL017076-PA [Aedes aegypti]|uniref:AAEL017076-PA n=1 Tax=Aedes aegypti TaxID=7159 RepID=J9HGK9_AEDAE|nr:AAEL017076-PA [Aedes aegypti]